MLRFFSLLLIFPICIIAQEHERNEDGDAPKPGGVPVSKDFTVETWSGKLPVPEPVALTVAPDGTVFVTQTERRKVGDLDIREHKEWIERDVALDSIEAKSRFYKENVLAIGKKGAVQDLNKDGAKDWRDLTVPTERIWRYRDTKNTGFADERSEFASGFNTEVTGIAAGILWHQGSILTTIAPDFWKLTDHDCDGKAEERTSLAHGFGMHIAYAGHDMHGPRVGPDGMIYWTIGDKGVSVTSKEGRRFHHPHRGCLMRCDPDGSNFEVVATGLRNTQEIVFDEYGNIFGEDNDADKPGERERLLYIVEGGDYGWQCGWQYRGKDYDPWLAERITGPRHPDQPAWVLPAIAYGHGGPAGFAYNPGTALGPKWERTFFSAQFTGSGKINAFQMEPDGAGFKVVNDRVVCEGVQAVDFAWGPDGKLYCADWEGGYDMNHVGYIRTLVQNGAEVDSRRAETQALLQAGMKGKEPGELVKLMGYPDMRVRLEAQFELAARKETQLLIEVAGDGKGKQAGDPDQRGGSHNADNLASHKNAGQLARIHALWGLGQIARRSGNTLSLPMETLVSLQTDEDSEIRAQFAKFTPHLPTPDFGKIVYQFLHDKSPRVRACAATAIGNRFKYTKPPFQSTAESDLRDEMVVSLVMMLEHNNDADVYIRQAAVYAWSECLQPHHLEWLPQDAEYWESPGVPRAIVLALRRQDSKLVSTFFRGHDSSIQTEAIAAYHDRNFNDPKPFDPEPLAVLLDNTDSVLKLPVGAQRRILNANLRSPAAAAPARLAKYAALSAAPMDLRNEALICLSLWEKPVGLDRVNGQHIVIDTAGRSRDLVQRATDPVFSKLDRERKLALSLLRLKNALGGKDSASGMAIVLDTKQSLDVRLAALEAEAANIDKNEKPALALLADDGQPAALRGKALVLVSAKHPTETEPFALTWLANPLASGTIPDARDSLATLALAQAAYQVAARSKTDAFDGLLATQLSAFTANKFSDALALDLLEAAAARGKSSSAVKKALAEVEKTRAEAAKTDVLAPYSECREGGDAANGEDIFLQNANAGCIRCHSHTDAIGALIGPNLKGIGNRVDRSYLLQSLVDPTAKIADGFGMITFILKDGKTAAGVIAKEDATTVILRLADNTTQEIPAAEITTRTPPISLMHPMQGILTKREIRDMVEYLANLKK